MNHTGHVQTRSGESLLEVRNLKTHFFTDEGVVKAVEDVSLTVRRGEVLGLVGESGCGKSATALSIMRLVDRPGRVIGGSIRLDGIDLLTLPEAKMVNVRGNRISMIFQQPLSSLDPTFKVGDHVVEAILAHRDVPKPTAWQQAVQLLHVVGIPDAERRANAYPHELSGGMAQRVMIAVALVCKPDLLIADEPTTALDVTIQAQILDLLRTLRTEFGMAVLLITHDLGVIAEIADRVAVMYAGQIIEEADVHTLFSRPMHPYTRGLIRSMPVLDEVKDRLEAIPGAVPDMLNLPSGCAFAPRCQDCAAHHLTICHEIHPELAPVGHGHAVRCWLSRDSEAHAHTAPRPLDTTMRRDSSVTHAAGSSEARIAHGISAASRGSRQDLVVVKQLVKHFPVRRGPFSRDPGAVKAVDGVSFTIREGETLGLVGESGCGKTTVGRSILRLTPITSGTVVVGGQDVVQAGKHELKALRRNMQMIFQDPFSSLDPRMQIGESIGLGLLVHGMRNPRERREVVTDTLRKVGLEAYHARRYPNAFSGGQRQRIGIARALALRPKFVVCDEPVSALDVSIQSQILNLLRDLQDDLHLTYLFIAHNLSVVRHVADRIAVMYLGKVVELADREELFRNPLHPYTRALISAVPAPNPGAARGRRIILEGDLPSPLNPPHGCRFHTRCPVAVERCARQEPELREVSPGHWAACWLA